MKGPVAQLFAQYSEQTFMHLICFIPSQASVPTLPVALGTSHRFVCSQKRVPTVFY